MANIKMTSSTPQSGVVSGLAQGIDEPILSASSSPLSGEVFADSAIILDKEKCIGCGACVALCPECFEMGQDNKARLKKESGKNTDCAKTAADSCPTQAITIK